MVTFLDDTIYLGLLAGAFIFTIWTFFSMRSFGDTGDDVTLSHNLVDSSFTSTSDLAKTMVDTSRAMSFLSSIFLCLFSVCFWEALGIYTLASSYANWNTDLGVFYITIGILMFVFLLIYWFIFSAAFLKNKIADFRGK